MLDPLSWYVDHHIILIMLLILQKINSPNLAHHINFYHTKLQIQLNDKLNNETANTNGQKC